MWDHAGGGVNGQQPKPQALTVYAALCFVKLVCPMSCCWPPWGRLQVVGIFG